jgi:hypothetical protein
MSNITDELNELIALHGNARDALNVTLAKLREARERIIILEEAALESAEAQVDIVLNRDACPECKTRYGYHATGCSLWLKEPPF